LKSEYGIDFKECKFQAASKMFFDKILLPLRTVAEYIYFNGPSRFGFWNGIDKEEACAELTRVPSTVWMKQYIL
jgi:hypothetical protein